MIAALKLVRILFASILTVIAVIIMNVGMLIHSFVYGVSDFLAMFQISTTLYSIYIFMKWHKSMQRRKEVSKEMQAEFEEFRSVMQAIAPQVQAFIDEQIRKELERRKNHSDESTPDKP